MTAITKPLLSSARSHTTTSCPHAGHAIGGDLEPILSDFAGQLLGSFQLASLVGDLLSLSPPPPVAHAAWHALLHAAACCDTLGLLAGERALVFCLYIPIFACTSLIVNWLL